MLACANASADPPPATLGEVTFEAGQRDPDDWSDVVAGAIKRIWAGDVEKVVLARDLRARTEQPIDPRLLLTRLAARYPGCWTFSVDGLLGATPEMLVKLERGLVTSRVLAGTIRRSQDDEHDLALAASLARSSKDLEEHEYAVRSVAEALEPHCSSMNVPEAPFVLHLPNVMHLATDVAGVVHYTADPVGTSLDLAWALHPSAAVGGTPTQAAVSLIAEIEARAGLEDVRRELSAALAHLSDSVRDAVQLRIVDELPYPDVAAELQISEPAARARVSRGLAALADFLDPIAIREATAI